MYVIAVNKLQAFLLNVPRLFNVFFDDDARDSTSTTNWCFFQQRRTLIKMQHYILMW